MQTYCYQIWKPQAALLGPSFGQIKEIRHCMHHFTARPCAECVLHDQKDRDYSDVKNVDI